MKSQINSLTSSRAFAALLVVIFHFARGIYPFYHAARLFTRGNIAVTYFYVLSGFVLFISYSGAPTGYGRFIARRLARIAPAYVLALALSVVVAVCVYHSAFDAVLVRQLLYSLFFVQAYFPAYALSLNAAGWSISVELLFYLLFPLLLLLQLKSIRFFIAATIAAYLGSQFVVLFIARSDTYGLFFYNPLLHINEFMAGMAGGWLFGRLRGMKALHGPLLPSFFCVLMFLALFFKPGAAVYDVGLLSPLFLAFIISTAIRNPRFLNWRPLVFLGEISYGIYILQFPVFALMGQLNVFLGLGETVFFVVALAVLMLAASLSFFFVEQPVRIRVNKALRSGA